MDQRTFRSVAFGPALLVTATILYTVFLPLRSGDMERFLLPWYQHIVAEGRIGAFEAPFANYTPPYLYLLSAATLLESILPPVILIKAVSVLGACGLAAATAHLLKTVGARDTARGGLWVLLIPTVIFNAPMLGQADTLWTAACVMAIAEGISKRPSHMLIWCGVAIAFKAQAAFVAPFILLVLLSDRVPLRLWPLPALVYLGAMLPAWLAGWPAYDLGAIYLKQAVLNVNYLGNAANPWSVIGYLGGSDWAPDYFWVGFAVAGCACATYLVALVRRECQPHDLLTAALTSAIILPFLFPQNARTVLLPSGHHRVRACLVGALPTNGSHRHIDPVLLNSGGSRIVRLERRSRVWVRSHARRADSTAGRTARDWA